MGYVTSGAPNKEPRSALAVKSATLKVSPTK